MNDDDFLILFGFTMCWIIILTYVIIIVFPQDYTNNSTDIECNFTIYQDQITNLNTSLEIWKERYYKLYSENYALKSKIKNYTRELANCESELMSCNESCNRIIEYTPIYDFDCNDWYHKEITNHRCVWDLRQLDHLGRFYHPAEACQNRLGHFWLHCACAEELSNE